MKQKRMAKGSWLSFWRGKQKEEISRGFFKVSRATGIRDRLLNNGVAPPPQIRWWWIIIVSVKSAATGKSSLPSYTFTSLTALKSRADQCGSPPFLLPPRGGFCSLNRNNISSSSSSSSVAAARAFTRKSHGISKNNHKILILKWLTQNKT